MSKKIISPIFQVSEFVEVVQHHLDLLGEVVVEGEISRIDVKNNRLIFATIKDSVSAVDVFGLTHQIRNLHQLEAGMKVQVSGYAGLYKGSGKFRLQANSINPVGEGALQRALEKLREELEGEGLFDDSHKRTLPQWPQNIGLITASGSSAYYDVVKILTVRMGGLHIKHMPVLVQGSQAVGSMLRALKYVNSHRNDFDALIITRGGGSLEDLKAFNDERLVRAVFACTVPTISAVGHEDDWSLIDYVADVRASTPSNASELLVSDREESLLYLTSTLKQMRQQVHMQISGKKQRVQRSVQSIQATFRSIIERVNIQIQILTGEKELVLVAIEQAASRMILQSRRLHDQTANTIGLAEQRLAGLSRVIESMNVSRTLKRGFSITRNEKSEIVTKGSQVKTGEKLETWLNKSIITSTIIKIGETHE